MSTTDQSTSVDSLITKLLELTKDETDGTKLPRDHREEIQSIVQQIEDQTKEFPPDSAGDFTSFPLEGEHRLIYIDSKRTPQYLGPFKGTTTQYFIDEENFQNRLTLGPLQIALSAKRKVMDSKRMKISFQSFGVNLFGNEVVKKETKQQGVWKMVYVGNITRSGDENSMIAGNEKRMLIRIMRTPSLYILAKDF
ncbi:hypothetical protein CTEN210_08168 [Chaetoceros tenuissimus]|uniref:Plastid lipid-associated protein/fibrillin conserved domain-containing protein n=1 Tax=Chaetoceros tenuissimus TaxID=426638 RepID=A0AAD3H5T9_9STRA|nr:hypothetical protein CTEN210_08168 [Chaetoceros tenuissimus]